MGPFADRIDMHIKVNPVSLENLEKCRDKFRWESSGSMRESVAKARAVQAERYRGTGYTLNCSLDEKGIEKYSRILMPVMLVMIVAIAVFALTLRYTDEAGVTRTGLQGLAVYLTPNFEGLTLKRFLQILLDAMRQIFFVYFMMNFSFLLMGYQIVDENSIAYRHLHL